MSNTPFIPPLNTPEGSPSSQPVIPGGGGSPNMANGWGAFPNEVSAGYPRFSPYQNPSPYIPTSPFVSPGVLPGQMNSRTSSRQSQGLSADWTGYPQGTPFVASNVPLTGAQPPPVSPYTHPGPPPGVYPYSPWYPPTAPATHPAFGGTPWPVPPQALPAHPTPWGMPPRNLPQTQAYTPWAPPTAIPPPAALGEWPISPPHPNQYFPPSDPHAWAMPIGNHQPAPVPRVPPQPPGQVLDRMGLFAEGDSYGPVLDPNLLPILGAQVRLNPLIAPVPDDGSNPVYLKWNMLFPTSTVQRSSDPSHISWSKGRDAPATFPRLKELRIISESIPWIIRVKAAKADRGITCAEVIDAIARDLFKNAGKDDFDSLSPSARTEIKAAYKYNRSPLPNVPGGSLGQGLKRLDFLRKNTMFSGIEVNANDRLVKRVFGHPMPGVFVLKCSHNMMTKKEVEDQQKRISRDHSRQSSRGRSRANSTSISVQSPTDTSSDEGDVDR